MSSLLSGAYNTTASVGSAMSYVQLGAGILFAAIMIIIGIVMLVRKPSPKDDDAPIKTIGGGVLLFGIIILFFTLVSFFLIQKSKPIAALAGTKNLIGITENIFKK
jgi:preprotein translocase subunit SecG